MSFANLSGLGVVLGVAGLAGALFLLQRLRVRYQPKRVVTTLFWKEALEEARARVLVRRRSDGSAPPGLLLLSCCW